MGKIKILGWFSFALLVILIVIMGAATIIEKSKGSEFVYENIYYSFAFKFLWLLMGGAGLIYIVCRDIYNQKPVFMLHCSFLAILLGAVVTHLTSINGYIHLRENEKNNAIMIPSTQTVMKIPFYLDLQKFEVAYYKGTQQPSDYISRVNVLNPHDGFTQEEVISMNKILDYKGYRFYQSSFDEDRKGSILSVNRDVLGIPITYTGYVMLLLSFIWVLLSPQGRFRMLLRSPLLKNSFLILIGAFLFHNVAVKADAMTVGRNTLSVSQSEKIGKLWMHYNGRICPVQTFAIDFTKKMTGKAHYMEYNSEQFIFGIFLFPEFWNNEPIFNIDNTQLASLLRVKSKASYNDLFDQNGNYKLSNYIDHPGLEKEELAFQKAVKKVHEQVQLVYMLQQGNYLELFPMTDSVGTIKWYSPADDLPEYANEQEQSMIKNALSMYYLCVSKEEEDLANQFIERISVYQKEKGGGSLPSNEKKQAELVYNAFSPFKLLFMINLTVGMIVLFAFVYLTVKGKRISVTLKRWVHFLLFTLFILHTLALVLRSYISGRLPMSNGYETMLIVSWFALFISVCMGRRGILLSAFGLLLSGFTLLVAHIAMLNPQITPLVPVLSSPLLTIHVAIIMMSYALAGFIVLNSLLALFLLAFSNSKTLEQNKEYTDRLKALSEVFLYPCAFLLGIGIFIGAVWANVSWGRYWGWDPKEVWALISFLLFSFAFHRTSLPWFKSSFFFHSYMIFSFLSILMTYFGVNYILGGMHSYAGTLDMSGALIISLIVLFFLVLLIIVAKRKYYYSSKK